MRLVRESIASIGSSLQDMKPETSQAVVPSHLSTTLLVDHSSSFGERPVTTMQRNPPQTMTPVLRVSPPQELVPGLALNPVHSESEEKPDPIYKLEPGTVSQRLISRPKRRTVLTSLEQNTYTTTLAVLHYQSRTTNLEPGFEDDCDSANRQQRIETSVAVHPKPWLLGRGLTLSFSTSGNSWIPQFGFQFRHYNVRSDEALIFEFCSFGNIEGVKSLLRRGDASPFDCDPEGWTPLHVCSSVLHSDHRLNLMCNYGSTQRRRTTMQYASY